MEHAAHMVDVLDAQGKVIGQKRRREIDKNKDIYHVVFVILVTPRGELVLSVIPAREDLPNLYSRQMGATVATIRRTRETAAHAARRGIDRELFIDKATIHLLGSQMLEMPDARPTFTSAYYMIADPPSIYSVIDIDTLVVVTPQQVRSLLTYHPKEIAPTMRKIWDTYCNKLPI